MAVQYLEVQSLNEERAQDKAYIFDIQRFSVQDGPGIRTTVFFKGCPLRCWWCDNPESQKISPQLLYFESLCVRCHSCVAACPTGATTIAPDGSIEINRERCKACGKCVEACPTEARAISGKLMTVDEVLEVVRKDALFYWNSGGGVTASGGEATYQSNFLIEFFIRCQELGFHTTLDTCGYVEGEVLERILQYTDLVLYDIKHMDAERHRELTGVGSELILENAERVARMGIPMIIRVPLMQGQNDSDENIDALAEFATKLRLTRIDLLPYHQLGEGKYQALGMKYKLKGMELFQKADVEDIKSRLESYGKEVEIV